jgi:hypothetical protein
VDDTQADLKDVQTRLNAVRSPAPKPSDPFPDPLSDPPYVQDLPKTGGLNAKGKKKKDLKKTEFKKIIDMIKAGGMDSQPWEPLMVDPERWPGGAQSQTLLTARAARNAMLDEERVAELARRDRAQVRGV